nr:fibrous sheath CABYR-binding protein-like [Nothobranchius furzeri]
MDCCGLSLLVVTILTGISCEQLTAVKNEESSLEGAPVTLSYSYSKISPGDYFFWNAEHQANQDSWEIILLAYEEHRTDQQQVRRKAEVSANEERAPQPSKVAPKLTKGRNARKAPEDAAELVQDIVILEDEVTPDHKEEKPPADAEHKVDENAAPVKKSELKPKRGTKPKRAAAQQRPDEPRLQPEDVSQAEEPKDASETCSEQLEVLLVAQAPEMMNPPSDEVACEATQSKPAAVRKKPVRGRKAMSTESKEAELKQDAAEPSEEPVGPAPVRGRRAKKTDAAAPSAVLKTTRTRNAKSPDMTTEQPAVETLVITEVSTEASDVQATQEKMDLLFYLEKVASKPARERKAKLTPAESKKSEDQNSENVASNPCFPQEPGYAQHPLPIPSAAGKPKRERKVEVEQSKVVDNTDVPEEIKPQPPKRNLTARNQVRNQGEQAEQEQVKPTEEIQTDEVVVPEKADAPPAEPEKSEQATVAAKPRRGG